MFPTATEANRQRGSDEAGFVLVAAMVVLLALTLFGIWALRTSSLEVEIAGSTQRVEKQFNIAEGGVVREVGKVGFTTETYYNINDPSIPNQVLAPTPGTNDFDPGDDIADGGGWVVDPADYTTWPRQNLLEGQDADANGTDDGDENNEFDYSYLVTYLYPDTPPKGYDPGSFSGYKFRIQGAAPAELEMGGMKVGPKVM